MQTESIIQMEAGKEAQVLDFSRCELVRSKNLVKTTLASASRIKKLVGLHVHVVSFKILSSVRIRNPAQNGLNEKN